MRKQTIRIKLAKDSPFYRELRDIVGFRRVTVDNKYPRDVSYDRILGALVKQSEWPNVKEKLKRIPRMEDFK